MEHKLGKRLICSLMALILALGCVPMPAAAQGDGTESISCYSNTASFGVAPLSGDTTEETVYSTVIPSTDLPDNEELFAYFAESMLYGYDISSYGVLNRNKLSHVEQGIYDVLKAEIEWVAMNGGSTEYWISDIDGLKTTWTNEELGVSSITESGVVNSFFQQFDTRRILDALLGDCPLDLYWFDKTVGMRIGYSMGTEGVTSGSQTVITKASISLCLGFTVASEFAEGEFTVTSDVSKVQTAMNNAAYVVSVNQGKTPYQKMVAYQEYICRAVDYNFDALEEGTPYGNPWQLIYVFDGDSSTKVVCEGYSKAFQYLCDLSGMDCLSVVGKMDGGDHMWNVVTLDGKNYHADVTNSDTGTIGQSGGLFLVGASYQNGGYTFHTVCRDCFYECEDYGLATSDYTPGHVCSSTKRIARVEPTCEKDGCEEYWQCTSCGKRYGDAACTNEVKDSELVIPATGHDMSNIPAKAATCTESGNYVYFVCNNCGGVYADEEGSVSTTVKQQTIPASGHTEETIDGYAATCTKDGLSNGVVCSVCGEILTAQQTITASGHDEEIVSGYAATCTKDGLRDGKKCRVCGTVTVEQEPIKALGHTVVVDVAKSATCTATGLTEGKHCSVCNEILVKQIVLEKLPHKEVVDKAVAATCTTTGLTAGKHCSVCKTVLEQQRSVDALGHKEVTLDGKAATCTENGLTEGKKCSVCGEITVEQKVLPAAHKEEPLPGKAASCTESGLTEGKRCSVCNKILLEQDSIPALKHKASLVSAQKATLTTSGLKRRYQCMNCKKYFADEYCTIEAEEESFIIPAVKTVQLSSTRYSYDGKTKTPKVGVYDSQGNKLVQDKDYTVTYAKGRKSVGQYNVTMKGIGDYDFRTTLTFQIVPPKSSIKSLTGKAKSFTASWSKKTSQVTGYQLQYSLDKNFETGVKTVTIKDNDVTSKTIKSLKSKKYYYVRIRTYKTVSGKNFYSSWSDVLRVKTK